MIELKSWRKQDNSTPWVGRAFGNILLLEGLPAVYTCCRELFHKSGEHSKFHFFYIYNFIRHFLIETWPTEAQRRQMPVKTFDNTIIKTNYGIDQYHKGWRFKNCADYLFCSFDFFYFWSGKRRRRNWFSDLYVNKW